MNSKFYSKVALFGFLFIFFVCRPQFSQAQITYTWLGNAGDNKWNNSGNWSPTGIPGASDDAIFDASGANNCLIDMDLNVRNITITPGFTKSLLTTAANITILENFAMDASLCNADFKSVSFLQIGSFRLLNGNFDAPTSNFFLSGGGSNEFTKSTFATFNHNNGSFYFNNSTNDISVDGVNLIFNELYFNNSGLVNFINSTVVRVAGSTNFGGGFGSINRSELIGGVEAYGNVNINSSYNGGNATLSFAGSSDQLLNVLSSGNFYGGNIIVNKTAGDVYLNSDLFLTGLGATLTLTDGIIFTGPYRLILANNTSVIGSNSNSYVSGKIRKYGNNDFVFPIGKNNIFAPIGLTSISSLGPSEYIEADYSDKGYFPETNISSSLGKLGRKEFWSLTPSKPGIGATALITLNWTQGNTFSEISDLTDLRIAGFFSSESWNSFTGNTLGTSDAGSITSSTAVSLDDYNTFTFGSVTNSLLINRLGVIDGDACGVAKPMNIGDTYNFNFRAASGINGNPNFSQFIFSNCPESPLIQNVHWISFVGNGEQVIFSYRKFGLTDVGLEIFEGCDAGLDPIECNRDFANRNLGFNTTLGTTYYVRMSNFNTNLDFLAGISIIPTPQVTYTAEPVVNPGNVLPGTSDQLIYAVRANVSNSPAAFTRITFNLEGTYSSTDVPDFTLYKSADNILDGNDPIMERYSSNSSGSGETFTFDFTRLEVLPSFDIGDNYLFLVMSVSASADPNNIRVKGLTASDIEIQNGNVTQNFPLPDGGLQSIVEITQNYCQGAVNLNIGDCNVNYEILDTYINTGGANVGACSITPFKDIWFKFRSNTNQTVRLEVSNVDEDAGVVIYTGNCFNLSAIQCVNDLSGSNTETLTLTLTANTDYFVRIMNVNGNNAMNGSVCLRRTTLAPTGDLRKEAAVLTLGANAVTLNVSNNHRNFEASANTACVLGNNRLDAWASFTAATTLTSVQYNNTNKNAGIAVYSINAGELVEEACIDNVTGFSAPEILDFETIVDQVYYIRIMNVADNNTMNGTIQVYNTPIPDIPTVLAATNIQAAQFTTNWTSTANTVEYLLDVATTSTFDVGTFVVQNRSIAHPLTNSLINSGVNSGTIYYYRVRAKSNSTISDYSTTISLITTPSATTATNITLDSFTANWTLVSGATSYLLDVSTDNFATFVGTYNNLDVGSVNNFSVSGLNPSFDYQYRIRAVDDLGTVSPSSNVILVNTLPPAPKAGPATNITQTSFTANWSLVPFADSYRLDVALNPDFSGFVTGYQNRNVGNVTSFDVVGLSVGNTYFYRVRALNNNGVSTNSGTISLPVLPSAPVLSPPSNITASGFTVNLQPTLGAEGFLLDISENQNFSTFVNGFDNLDILTNLSFVVNGLESGKTYYYRLRAYNVSGNSPNTAAQMIVTLVGAPVATAATNITTNSFTANWEATSGATSYRLDVATDNLFNNLVSGFNNLNVGNNLSQTVNGLIANTNYFYRVRAINTSGTSANSNDISLTTLPSAPIAPTATAASNISQTEFTANWQTLAGASEYLLDVSDNQNFTSFINGFENLNVGSNLSQNITGLNAGTTYFYRVKGRNAGGTSPNSNVISQITVPSAPVAQNASTVLNTSFIANWQTVNGASYYELDVATDNTFNNFVNGFQALNVGAVDNYTVTGLSVESNYFYRVRAINDNGNGISPNSNIISVTTTPDFPNPPVAIAATNITKNSFTANWQTAVGADSYRLDVATDANFANLFLQNFNADVNLSADINGLSPGVTYYYRVRGVNTLGPSLNSNTISQITIPTEPLALSASNLVLNPQNPGFTARWNQVAGASAYRLDVATDNLFSVGSILPNLDDLDVGNVNSFVLNNLILGGTYFYRVRAINSAGASANSNVITTVIIPNPADIPTIPGSLGTFTLSPTEIEISFFDNADNETGFEIQRATDLLGPYTAIATLPAELGPAPNAVAYLDNDNGNGLLPNTIYYYRVRALGNIANSAYTLPVQASTLSDAPERPLNLEAFSKSSTQILLIWRDVSGNEDGFNIYRRTEDTEFVKVASVGANIQNYVDEGLTPQTVYVYFIRAFKGLSESELSNLSGAFTTPVPGAPSNLVATATGQRSVQINWQDNSLDEDSIVVEMASIYTNGVFLFLKRLPANTTNFLIDENTTDLDPNQVYFFRVVAENEFGPSPSSNADSARTFIDPTILPPIAPSDLKAEPVSTIEISLRWRDNSENENVFIIERSESESGPYEFVDVVLAGTTNYSDLGLRAGTTYYYRIFALNGGGNSPYSDTTFAQAICNVITIINTDLPGNGSITCDSKEILLEVNSNINQGRYQWYKNDVAIPEATLPFIIASETGEYYCRIVAGDCDKKSEIKSVIISPSFGVEIFLENVGQDQLSSNFLGADAYQWYYEYEPINGANSDSYTPTRVGLYYLIVTNNGCSATSNIIYYGVTAVEEVNISNQIKVTPNPSDGKIQFTLDGGVWGDYELNIIDMTGRSILIDNGKKEEIKLKLDLQLEALPQGVYFLEYRSGKQVGRKRIVKQ
jgi:hypothetical protein